MPAIPWQAIVAMRHRLVHGYDEINHEVVWKVATHEAHALIKALKDALADWPLDGPGESRD